MRPTISPSCRSSWIALGRVPLGLDTPRTMTDSVPIRRSTEPEIVPEREGGLTVGEERSGTHGLDPKGTS